MSRSGYTDDGYDQWEMIKWRGQVASAIRGKRGQKLLVDLYQALEAMPDKKLIRNELEKEDGSVCALGALGKERGVELKDIDPEDYRKIADTFGIAHQLACEIMFLNDELWHTSPADRYHYMKNWVRNQIKPENLPI